MVQTYTLPLDSHTVDDAISTHIYNDLEALRSSFAGASAPSSPTPVNGQWFLDTDDNLLYIYDSSATVRLFGKATANNSYQHSTFEIANANTFPGFFTATMTVKLFNPISAITIIGCSLISSAAAATHASDYYTFNLQNGGTGGGGSTSICSQTTNSAGGAAITADTSYSLGTISNANIAANEMLKIVMTKTGTPISLATARIYLMIQYRNN